MKGLVVVKSGGDIATGVAHRLFQSGYSVVITEVDTPTVIRRTVAFAQAVFNGETIVEGVRAKRVGISEVADTLLAGFIPVLIDPMGKYIAELKPCAVVDAILAKCNTGTTLHDAPIVIGVGPGFTAGIDVCAVVETMRGHHLGRVYYQGAAIADTGIPGEIAGYALERLIKSPASGVFVTSYFIGDSVGVDEVVGHVDGVKVKASISGILRGLIHEGVPVKTGMKIGDIDPRCCKDHCYTISDKARSVAGGVLEALLNKGL